MVEWLANNALGLNKNLLDLVQCNHFMVRRYLYVL
jgi:hypothetical protein